MTVARIRGMRDLETQQVRKLPERIETAQRNAFVGDEELCRLMGWQLTELMAVKAADWVILGEHIEITEADRLRVEVRQLRARIRELEAELLRYQRLEASLEAVTRKLGRR